VAHLINSLKIQEKQWTNILYKKTVVQSYLTKPMHLNQAVQSRVEKLSFPNLRDWGLREL